MRSTLSIFYTFLLIFLPLHTHAITTIKGNNGDAQKTFAFSIGSTAVDATANILYCAADQSVNKLELAKEFAISSFNQNTHLLEPITPPTTTINITQSAKPNPLYDAGFRALAVMHIGGESLPIVLTQDSPKTVFMFEQASSTNNSILETTPLNDAHITPTQVGSIFLLASDNNGHIFTCTTPSAAPFGEVGSGIGVVVRGFKKENDVQVRAFQQVDAITGNVESPPIALPFDKTSPFLTMNGISLDQLTPTVLYWDSILQRLYIGTNATSSADSNAGLRSIAVGRMEGHKLIVEEIVPASVFNGTNTNLLGGQQADQTIFINQITTMHTSGNRSYLILLGNGTTSANVQVFPLVQSNNARTHGTIASKNATAEDIFVQGAGNLFVYQATVIPQQATLPEDLYLLTDPVLAVGGGIILPGTISSMYTVGDSLYVTIKDSTDPLLNGLYQTTAIIEHTNKKIVGWTQWQPVLQLSNNIIYATTERKTNLLSFLVADDNFTPNILLQTQWLTATNNNSSLAPLSDFLQIYSSSSNTTIQKVELYFSKTPSIVQGSIAAFLQQNSVTLSLITQINSDGIEKQTTANDLATIQVFNNSTVSSQPAASTVVIEGTEIGAIGIPTSACIAYNSTSNDGWIAVGGTQGCVIFSDATGKGWPQDSGIGSQFANIPIGFSARTFLAVSDIQKIAATDGFLYLLTDTTLYRTPINPTFLASNTITLIPVVTTQHHSFAGRNVHFTTMLISDPLLLLGTTNGLFSNPPGTLVDGVTPADFWHLIELPESASSVQTIFWTNSTGYEGDCARNQGSVIYIHTQDKGQQFGRINRLYITPTNSTVTESTVSLFDDRRLQATESHFLDFGTSNYQSCMGNGNSFFVAKNKTATTFNGTSILSPSRISIAAPETANGHNPFLGITQWGVAPLALRDTIAGLKTIPGHGGWMITDTQQLYINQ